MRNKNTKLTTLESQPFYRVVLLVRYTGEKRNQYSRHPKFDLPMEKYYSYGKYYEYQEFELWGPYLSESVAKREARSAGSYETAIYPDDYDVIIEECEPEWLRVNV
jgi:hypothetical protein